MKRVTILISFLPLVVLIHAQTYISFTDGKYVNSVDKSQYKRDVKIENDGVLVTYTMEYASVIKDPLYKGAMMLQMDGFGYNSTIGEPYYPRRIDSFTLPDGATADISIVDSKYIDIPFRLSPSRPEILETEDNSKINVPDIKPYSGFYPTEVVTKLIIQKYRGAPIAKCIFQPVQYNYQTSTIRVFSYVKYKVQFKEGKGVIKKNKVSPNDYFLKNTTLNRGLTTPSSLNRSIPSNTNMEITKDYLIITIPMYASVINRFVEWKKLMGYRVTVSIRNTWTVSDVLNEVESKYADLDNLYYLLIVGSHSQVPAKQMGDMNYYSDYYYGCANCSSDSLPNINVGRLPVTSVREASVVLNKIIDYEKEPITDSIFYSTGIHCANFQCDTIPSNYDFGRETSRFTQTAERIRDYVVGNGKTVYRNYYTAHNSFPLFWNNNPDYYSTGGNVPIYLRKPQFAWDGNANQIISEINNGAFYVLYRGHGLVEEWISPWFHVNHLSQLNNWNKLPVVFSVNCDTGNFSGTTRCLADRLLTMGDGGAVGVIAAVTTTLSGSNDAFAEGMFESIWPTPGLLQSFGAPNYSGSTGVPTYELGMILSQGREKMLSIFPKITKPSGEEYGWYQWARRAFHCFGDPSMEIRTEIPTTFDNININRLPNSITVNLGNEIARITFYDSQNGSVYSYEGMSAVYNGNSSDVTVCIYAHNKLPIQNTPTTPIFIQNDVVTGNKSIGAGVIKVGTNVTDTKTQGAVTFNGGIINLYGNVVELYGETTVALGTELNIINNQ